MVSAGLLPVSLGHALVLLCRAVLAWVVSFGRRAPVVVEVTFDDVEPKTRPSARRFHTWGDIRRFVGARYPELSRELANELATAIAFDAHCPDWGTDWSAWIEDNYERLLERAQRDES